MTITRVAGARIFGLPDDMAPPETRTEVLSKLLASYPSAVGWQSLLHRGVAAWQEHGAGWVARVQWQMPKPTGNDELRRDFLLTEVAPRSESLNRGWLRPGVGKAHAQLSELASWFPLLFGLSMFARYQPDLWTRLLNVDASPEAVAIEELLERALSALPRLILLAVTRRPIYFSQ